MTVRRITSRVICAIFGATANSTPNGQSAMLSAAAWAITGVWRATASRWKGGSIRRRRSRWTSSSISRTDVGPSRPVSIALASPAW